LSQRPRPLRRPRPATALALFALWAALSLLGGCGRAATQPPSKAARDQPQNISMREVQFPLRELRFPSGLRVLAEQDRRSPLVGLFLVVGSGATSDPLGKEGLAHYVEHLTFRSRPFGRRSFQNMLERAGVGAFNAETRPDATIFYELGPASALNELVRLEGARMLAPVAHLSPEELGVEVDVVRSELLQRDESGFVTSALATMRAKIFPDGHPYRRPRAGTNEGLSSIGAADVEAFVKRHYRPDNMTLVVLGDIDFATIERTIREGLPPALLEADPAAAPPAQRAPRPARPAVPPPPPPGAPFVLIHAAVDQQELWVAWSLPGSPEGGELVFDLMTGALHNVLNKSFKGEDDDRVRIRVLPGVQGSTLLCRLKLARGESAEKVLGQVFDSIDAWQDSWRHSNGRSHSSFVDAVLLPTLRQQLAVQLVGNAQSLVRRGRERALAVHFLRDPSVFARKLQKINTLSVDDFVDYMRGYVTRERARAVLFAPTRPDASRSRGGAPGATASSKAGAPWGAPDDEDRGQVLPALDKLNDAPVGASPERLRALAPGLGVSAYRQFTLPNGLRVVLGPRAGLPVVSLGLLVSGGYRETNDVNSAFLAEQVSVKRRSQNGSPERFGGIETFSSLPDASLYQLQGASGNVESMVAILAESMLTMRVDDDEWSTGQSTNIATLNDLEKEPSWSANVAVRGALFGGSPHAQSLTARGMKDANVRAAEAWVEGLHTPGNAVLAVVGEFNPSRVEAAVREFFGVWRNGPPPPPAPAPLAPVAARAAAPRVVQIDRPGAKKASISFACLLPLATTGAAATRHMLSARLLRDQMNERLRERLGITYDVNVGAGWLREGTSTLVVEASTEITRLPALLGELRGALASLADRGPSSNELDWAKRREAQRHATRFTTDNAALFALLASVKNGYGIGWVDAHVDELARADAASVKAEFEGCAGGRPTLLVEGEPAAVRAAVKATWPEAK
jgi:zinc protease